MKFLFLSLFVFYSAFALDCPGGSDPWETGTSGVMNSSVYGPGGQVDYKYRGDIQNGYQVKIDWDTFVNNSDYLPSSVLKKMLKIQVLKDISPDIDGVSVTVNIYRKTTCNASVPAYVELNKNVQLKCCDPNSNIQPEILEETDDQGNVHYLYKLTRSVNCGEKCCRTEYLIETHYNSFEDEIIAEVSEVGTYTETDNCSGQYQYNDCLTGDSIPCNGSCD